MDLRDNYYFRAYASDNTAGFIVTSETKIIKISFNTSRTAFTYRSEHRSGHDGSSSSDGIKESELKIYINDVLLVDRSYSKDSAPYPDSFQEYEDTVVCAVANKVRVYARTLGTANSNTYRVTSTIDETYYVYVVLSSLTIGSTNQNKNIILPSTASNTGAIKFIKNMDTNYILVTTFADEWLEVTSGNRALIMWQYHCVTLIPSQSSTWSIAGYYSNNLESRGSITGNTNKIGYAVAGKVNTFSVNTNTDRQTGDNNVVLPLEESGKLCIVAYMGDLSAKNKNENNVLTFSTTSGNGIDNKYNNSNSFPFILSNDSDYYEARERSAGIVFISDGVRWYIVGWYSTYCRTWLRNATPAVTSLSSASGVIFNYASTSPLTTTANYRLPQYNPSGNNKYLFILKNRQVTGGNGITVYANPEGTATTNPDTVNNVINESINYTGGGCDDKSYGCMWIVSEVRPGETRLHWYPVLNIN